MVNKAHKRIKNIKKYVILSLLAILLILCKCLNLAVAYLKNIKKRNDCTFIAVNAVYADIECIKVKLNC